MNEVVELSVAREIFDLERQHDQLEAEIAELLSYPWINNFLINKLKRKKLRIKERITRLKERLYFNQQSASTVVPIR